MVDESMPATPISPKQANGSRRLGDVNGKRALDVACGEGHYSRLLRQAGAEEVVGIDISERMIDLARASEGGGASAWHRVPRGGNTQERAATEFRSRRGRVAACLRA